jgi:hypothetical protein
LCIKQLSQRQFQSPFGFSLHAITRASSKAQVSLPEDAGPENKMDPGSLSFAMSSVSKSDALW